MSSREKEEGIYIGNQLDKAEVRNPIGRLLVNRFDAALLRALERVKPESVHEVGCGEGRLSRLIAAEFGIEVLATDFSDKLIERNCSVDCQGVDFAKKSIYNLDPRLDRRDVVVCCEVLEHLEKPADGLRRLRDLGARHYILSVPREPVWRLLNLARGSYLPSLGNTPGHLNHWSWRSFRTLLEDHGFVVLHRYNPFPWLMVSATVV